MLGPTEADVHNSLGTALAFQGHLDKGIQYFRQTVRLKPGFTVAHYKLGNALRSLERPQEAIESFRQALKVALAHGNHQLAPTIRQTLENTDEVLTQADSRAGH